MTGLALSVDTYVMQPSDFADGCFIREVNGKRYGTGQNALGVNVTLPLGVPLCVGCDSEIVDGLCTQCELAFTHPRAEIWL